MHWTDRAIILSVRRHGETSAILHLFTPEHGRHAGLVHGAAGRRLRGVLQPGNEVDASWSARLADHLGSLKVEMHRARAAACLGDPLKLAALTSFCALAETALPERDPHPALYETALLFLDALEADDEIWSALYVRWELGLLAELGYGLELDRCAATGETEDLIFISPKTGRAVSAAAGAPYAARLLRLPEFMKSARRMSAAAASLPPEDILDGLAATGHFLARRLYIAIGRDMPVARDRFVDKFAKLSTKSGGMTSS